MSKIYEEDEKRMYIEAFKASGKLTAYIYLPKYKKCGRKFMYKNKINCYN